MNLVFFNGQCSCFSVELYLQHSKLDTNKPLDANPCEFGHFMAGR